MKICSNCGYENIDNGKFCSECGYNLLSGESSSCQNGESEDQDFLDEDCVDDFSDDEDDSSSKESSFTGKYTEPTTGTVTFYEG